MERMIVNRLTWFLEKNNLLNIFQSGFRKNKNTLDQLLRLSDCLVKNLANKRYVLGVFIDFEKAYDMIWRKGVLFKIHNLGIGGNMFNWVNSFLSNRSLQVRVGDSFSTTAVVENGLPQGSVISPLLFLIAINDLRPPSVNYSLFADDVALWKSSKNTAYLEKQIQQALNYIEEWCATWGFRVSVTKTTFVLFHKGKQKPINLLFNGNKLAKSNSAKFLGVIFDQSLSWKDHINYVIGRCQKRINVLKLLSGSKWGADKETMVTLYKTLIRSVLDYGCPVYNTASKSLKKKLDVIQSQALRLCSGALRCTPVSALEVECGVPPLQLRRNHICAKSALRYMYNFSRTQKIQNS